MAKAGLPPRPTRLKWPAERILTAAKTDRQRPTAERWRAAHPDRPTTRTVQDRFGSFSAMLEEAGLA